MLEKVNKLTSYFSTYTIRGRRAYSKDDTKKEISFPLSFTYNAIFARTKFLPIVLSSLKKRFSEIADGGWELTIGKTRHCQTATIPFRPISWEIHLTVISASISCLHSSRIRR